ncbi:MAG TPA: PQQ-dependent sugar dehydrogenase [Kofleriaceae bacterium]|nr:PQQ-dependent sugar dehydrogenase [Kofleriaceae bacterium]
MSAVLSIAASVSCFGARPSKGGGQISRHDAAEAARRTPSPYDVEVPPGYRVELVADQLTFPTGVAFGDGNEIYVVESGYSYGEKIGRPRILRIGGDGKPVELATGDGAPWNGIAYQGGALYVARGGELEGGSIVRYPVRGVVLGEPQVLVANLPSTGDHHTNGPVVSRDGWVYFGVGSATNSAVVGTDNAEFGWLARNPKFHDVPCADIKLTGTSFKSKNPLTPGDDEVTTGPYLPFGTPATPGQVIQGRVPCSGAVMRVRTTGGDVELVAWGFRNPFGLALDAQGSLYVTDNGYDVRGSRPVFGSADMLWRVERGQWYGWPDYSEGRPLTAKFYDEGGGAPHGFMLAEHPGTPPEPAVYFAAHSSSDGFDFSRSAAFGHVGSAFVAQFGDMAPGAGKVLAPVGFAVVKVNPADGDIEYFARNRQDKTGPASERETRGFERPIAARFDRDGKALYVVDFGILRMTDKGPQPMPGTGALWRIVREEVRHAAR